MGSWRTDKTTSRMRNRTFQSPASPSCSFKLCYCAKFHPPSHRASSRMHFSCHPLPSSVSERYPPLKVSNVNSGALPSAYSLCDYESKMDESDPKTRRRRQCICPATFTYLRSWLCLAQLLGQVAGRQQFVPICPVGCLTGIYTQACPNLL